MKLAYRTRNGTQHDIWAFDPSFGITAPGTSLVSPYTNLTNGHGQNYNPAWRPDREEIAFTSNRDGRWSIYLHELGGGTRILIPASPNQALYQPAWSPDGNFLAYVQTDFPEDKPGRRALDRFTPEFIDWGSGPPPTRIHVKRMLSSGVVDEATRFPELPSQREFDPCTRPCFAPTWSAELGGSLVYSTRYLEVVDLMPLAGSWRTVRHRMPESILTLCGGEPGAERYRARGYQPRWGRAGILFAWNPPGTERLTDLSTEIWVMNATLDQARPVVQSTHRWSEPQEVITDPTWLPDGRVTFARYPASELSASPGHVQEWPGNYKTLWTTAGPAWAMSNPPDPSRVSERPVWAFQSPFFWPGTPRWEPLADRRTDVDIAYYEPAWQHTLQDFLPHRFDN